MKNKNKNLKWKLLSVNCLIKLDEKSLLESTQKRGGVGKVLVTADH